MLNNRLDKFHFLGTFLYRKIINLVPEYSLSILLYASAHRKANPTSVQDYRWQLISIYVLNVSLSLYIITIAIENSGGVTVPSTEYFNYISICRLCQFKYSWGVSRLVFTFSSDFFTIINTMVTHIKDKVCTNIIFYVVILHLLSIKGSHKRCIFQVSLEYHVFYI